MQSYLAMIRCPEPGHFLVEYPDLPGCKATAESFPDARRVAVPVLADYIRILRAKGLALPPPRNMKELQDSGATLDGIPALIPVLVN